MDLNELSKQKISHYIVKAADSYADNARKLGRKDTESTVDHEGEGKLHKKMMKRMSGISKASSRLAKEDVEQIDELKTATLQSYVKKANKEKFGHHPDSHKARKRDAGIFKATNTIADRKTDDRVAKKFGLKKKVHEELGPENEVGTPALVRKYKAMTPGQEDAEIPTNEMTSDKAYRYFNKAASNRGKAEKKGDDRTVAKRDKGLKMAFDRMMKDRK